MLIMKFLLLIAAVIFISGCAQSSSPQFTAEAAGGACVNYCRQIASSRDLSLGPCIMDPINNTDWVCDVAHEPRQDIDDRAENQCAAYRSGAARHFVEVTPLCVFIRSV